MENAFDVAEKVNNAVNGIVWGPYMLVLLVGTGIIFTIWSKFFQIAKSKLWWKGTFGTLFDNLQVDENAQFSPRQKLNMIASGWILLVSGILLALYAVWSMVNTSTYNALMSGYSRNLPFSDNEIVNILFLLVAIVFIVLGGIKLFMLKYNITTKQLSIEEDSNITPFQAVTTALASTVGTGNIAGVATAIYIGGPGAVFWMWVSGFFGMMTKYAEVVLAVKYREVDADGTHHGGPMYYIEKGLKMKWLAVIFAIFGTLATFGIGNMTQANAVAGSLDGSFGIPPLATGIAIAIFCGLVIIGGIKRIATVTEKLVPFMAIFYFVGGIIIILANITSLPAAFGAIFSTAFSFQSVGGGLMGYVIMRAMRYGIARGVFSNEAGLGSAPIAHAASRTKDPVQQGLWGVFEVFVDTIIICSLTALVILTAGLYQGNVSGAPLVQASFASTFGPLGGYFITFAVLCFACSTILGWSYYGQQCLGYLTKRNAIVDKCYKVIFSLMVIVGAMGGLPFVRNAVTGSLEFVWRLPDTLRGLNFVWDVADTLNGLMAIPNLIALLLLSKVVMTLTKEYLAKKN